MKQNNFIPQIVVWLLVNVLAVVLQLIIGICDLQQIAFPIHSYMFGLMIAIAIIFTLIYDKSKFGLFLAGYRSAIVSIVGLSSWAIILGVTTQVSAQTHAHDFAGHLGIRHMTSFYPFVFSYAYLVLSLCFATVRRLGQGFSMKNIGFFLNHAGLLFALYFIGAGAADVRQYTLTVQEGQTEWRGINAKTGKAQELPIAIYLDDFVMEEYPPKLAIVHRTTGKVQPEELPQYFDIDTLRPEGRLQNWQLTVEDFFMDGIRANDSTYQEIRMPGACPAALITAINVKTGERQKAWLSAGNNMQLYKFLPIGNPADSLVIAMTQPEPKAYYSDVSVFLKSGESIENKRVEVNHPLEADHWLIYQSDYDKTLGTMSITSVFDLVFDPWKNYIMASLIMLALGCLFLFWRV